MIGIMGKTHGVKIAARPNPKAATRNNARPCESSAEAGIRDVVVATAPGFTSMYPAGAAPKAEGKSQGDSVERFCLGSSNGEQEQKRRR